MDRWTTTKIMNPYRTSMQRYNEQRSYSLFTLWCQNAHDSPSFSLTGPRFLTDCFGQIGGHLHTWAHVRNMNKHRTHPHIHNHMQTCKCVCTLTKACVCAHVQKSTLSGALSKSSNHAHHFLHSPHSLTWRWHARTTIKSFCSQIPWETEKPFSPFASPNPRRSGKSILITTTRPPFHPVSTCT